MNPSWVRVGVWGGGALVSAGVAGMAWLAQPVEVPLIGLLVLTFVPTTDLTRALQNRLPDDKKQ